MKIQKYCFYGIQDVEGPNITKCTQRGVAVEIVDKNFSLKSNILSSLLLGEKVVLQSVISQYFFDI